jgi:predicted nucleic acid-binding protein
MVILDTSVWIEFLKGNPKFFKKVISLLEENRVYALECIFAELMQGTLNNRERKIIFEYWKNLPKPDIDNIMLKAGWESSKQKWTSKGIGLIDSVILFTARETQSTIWTLDNKLRVILKKEEIHA